MNTCSAANKDGLVVAASDSLLRWSDTSSAQPNPAISTASNNSAVTRTTARPAAGRLARSHTHRQRPILWERKKLESPRNIRRL